MHISIRFYALDPRLQKKYDEPSKGPSTKLAGGH